MLQLFIFNVFFSTEVLIDVAFVRCVNLVVKLGPS